MVLVMVFGPPTISVGDPLIVSYIKKDALAVLGPLLLPRSLNSKFCIDSNPAAYMVDQTFECIRKIENLQHDCTNLITLNAESYYKEFTILGSFLLPDITFANFSTNDSLKIPVNFEHYTWFKVKQPILCVEDGSVMSCPSSVILNHTPAYNKRTKTCENVVVQIDYNISHQVFSISTAEIKITLGKITDKSILKQKFTSTFVWAGKKLTFQRSGNPGYQVGKPILAGKLLDTIDEAGNAISIISLNSDPHNWITLLTSSKYGDCELSLSKRTVVTFGHNMRSGCFLRLSFSNISRVCDELRKTTLLALDGDERPNYVGIFGNSNYNRIGEWVNILIENEPPEFSDNINPSTEGTCTNIIMGLHVEIAYSRAGSLTNPQNKIIGVVYRYEEPQDIAVECIGYYCQGSSPENFQLFEVSSSVTFIDVSQPAVPVHAKHPGFNLKFPADFFYPLTQSNGIRYGQSYHLKIIISFYVIHYLQQYT